MKTALSLTLIASLVGSALPVAAQEKTETTAGPLARAITREVIRLAAVPQSHVAESEWSQVKRLTLGTEVTVTVQGCPYQIFGSRSSC
jgi:hypothetical protein